MHCHQPNACACGSEAVRKTLLDFQATIQRLMYPGGLFARRTARRGLHGNFASKQENKGIAITVRDQSSSMSESSSNTLASFSASSTSSLGTCSNLRPVLSQIHPISSSIFLL